MLKRLYHVEITKVENIQMGFVTGVPVGWFQLEWHAISVLAKDHKPTLPSKKEFLLQSHHGRATAAKNITNQRWFDFICVRSLFVCD